MSCCDSHVKFKQLFGGGAGWWYLICDKCGKVYRSVHVSDRKAMKKYQSTYSR